MLGLSEGANSKAALVGGPLAEILSERAFDQFAQVLILIGRDFLIELSRSISASGRNDGSPRRVANATSEYTGFGLRRSSISVSFGGIPACTLVLGANPHDKICVTSNATLGFHAAFDFGRNGQTITNLEATQMLYATYPTKVRRWISRRGGLTPHMIFLRGKQLQAMYRPCYLDD